MTALIRNRRWNPVAKAAGRKFDCRNERCADIVDISCLGKDKPPALRARQREALPSTSGGAFLLHLRKRLVIQYASRAAIAMAWRAGICAPCRSTRDWHDGRP